MQLLSRYSGFLSNLAAPRQQLFMCRNLYLWLDDPFQPPPKLAGLHDGQLRLALEG